MSRKVLITGGTGLIGKNLTAMLLRRNYEVAWLSREKQPTKDVRVFQWHVEKGYLEEGALDQVQFLIHLSGAGLADKRWTPERKRLILESRTQGVALLAQKLSEKGIKPQAFISASGSSYYGEDTGDNRNTEATHAGDDFLSSVTVAWEKAADEMASMGIRTVKLRTGVVLSAAGGALKKIALPARFGFGAALGSGRQWLSWIHIDDLCRLYVAAMENETWVGPYNAVAPSPVNNRQFTEAICHALHRPCWLPNVPAFALRMALGSMANLVLGSNYVVNQRLAVETDFQYMYPDLGGALADIFQQV
jgi:uncharacterized protein (TIGR01777 family)